MNKFFNPLIRLIDQWAARRVVRVALFGQGLALAEWESLSTTPYLKTHPRVQLVEQPGEAEVLAIHGPITALNQTLLLEWVGKARPGTRLIGVGAELEINTDGHILAHDWIAPFKVTTVLPGHPPTPEELLQTIRDVMERPHV